MDLKPSDIIVRPVWADGLQVLDDTYGDVELTLYVRTNDSEDVFDFDSRNQKTISMQGRQLTRHCLFLVADYQASCDQCQVRSEEYCFTPTEEISGLSLSASRTTLGPSGSVSFSLGVERGSDVTWSYKIEDEWIDTQPSFDYTFQTAGIYNLQVEAKNNISSSRETLQITVMNVPVITELTISPDGTIYKGDRRNFEAILRADSPEVTFFTWKVRCQSDDQLKIEENSTETSFSYQFENYGNYVFEVVGVNDIGSSEPFRLTNNIYEPIENLSIDIEDGEVLPSKEKVTVNIGMDYGSNVTMRAYPDYETFPEDYFPIFGRSFILEYDTTGNFVLHIDASNGISNSDITRQIQVMERISGVECIYLDQIDGEKTFPVFVQPGSSGTVAALVSTGSDYEVMWSFEETSETGTTYPRTFKFEETADYQFNLSIENELGVDETTCYLSVRLPLSTFPSLEFVSRDTYYNANEKRLQQGCFDWTICQPVFTSGTLLIIRIPRGYSDITIVKIKIDDQDDVLTRFEYGNNREKIISVELDQINGQRSLTVTVENGVSSLSQSLIMITLPLLDSIEIIPNDPTICLRDTSDPAAEVDNACLLKIHSDFQEFSLSSEMSNKLFNAEWYLNGEPVFSGGVGESYNFIGSAAYTYSQVKVVLTDFRTSRLLESEIDILSVPHLDWNLVVDIEEFPYSQNVDGWGQGVSIFADDCLHFLLNIENFDSRMKLSASFTIQYGQSIVDQDSSLYPYSEEFPTFRPNDQFQHKFIEPSEYKVTAVLQNQARRYISDGYPPPFATGGLHYLVYKF